MKVLSNWLPSIDPFSMLGTKSRWLRIARLVEAVSQVVKACSSQAAKPWKEALVERRAKRFAVISRAVFWIKPNSPIHSPR